jgi:hypothetical protein
MSTPLGTTQVQLLRLVAPVVEVGRRLRYRVAPTLRVWEVFPEQVAVWASEEMGALPAFRAAEQIRTRDDLEQVPAVGVSGISVEHSAVAASAAVWVVEELLAVALPATLRPVPSVEHSGRWAIPWVLAPRIRKTKTMVRRIAAQRALVVELHQGQREPLPLRALLPRFLPVDSERVARRCRFPLASLALLRKAQRPAS